MFQADNYISFHDLSPEARILWVSPSMMDVLGYSSEDVVGRNAYDIIYPDDHTQGRVVHKENVMNDFVASQVVLRYKAKDGRAVPCVAVFSLCYDFILNCSTLVDPSAAAYRHLRAHSSAMTRLVGSRKAEFERIKRHHEAFAANSWNHHGLEPELRVCMIMNRFTRNLVIMYASSACESIFHIDADSIVGKPVLLFVRADDLAPFVEQMDSVKASSAISHMRFWFQSPHWPREIPCEAIMFGAADGIVAIMRRCKPFLRKQFITDSSHCGPYHHHNNNNNKSLGSSWSSLASAARSRLSTPSTSFNSTSSLKYPSQTASPGYYAASRARLNKIRIVDENDGRLRPLAIPKDDPNLLSDTSLPAAFKEHRAQYVEEEEEDDDSIEVENEEEVERLSIGLDDGETHMDFNLVQGTKEMDIGGGNRFHYQQQQQQQQQYYDSHHDHGSVYNSQYSSHSNILDRTRNNRTSQS